MVSASSGPSWGSSLPAVAWASGEKWGLKCCQVPCQAPQLRTEGESACRVCPVSPGRCLCLDLGSRGPLSRASSAFPSLEPALPPLPSVLAALTAASGDAFPLRMLLDSEPSRRRCLQSDRVLVGVHVNMLFLDFVVEFMLMSGYTWQLGTGLGEAVAVLQTSSLP